VNARWVKELKLLAPSWGVALLLAAGGPQFLRFGRLADVPFFVFALGCVLLAIAPFGREFSQRTFPLLLSQPVPRAALWREKALVLLVALGVVAVAFWLCSPPEMAAKPLDGTSDPMLLRKPVALITLLAFSGGLWTTLLFRQLTPALFFMVLTPVAIMAVTSEVASKLWPKAEESIVAGALLSYAILGIAASYWLLLRAQEVQWLGQELAVPGFPRRGGRRAVGSETTPVRRPVWALFSKELQLQQINAIGAAGALLFFLAVGSLSYLLGTERGFLVRQLVGMFFLVLCAVLPLLVGAVAIAEERKLGTLDAHQCLPVSRRKQFSVKLLALYASLAAGSLAGGVCLALSRWVTGDVAPKDSFDLLLIFCLAYPLVAGTLAFYASSLARNTLQALGLALTFTVVGLIGVVFLTGPVQPFGIATGTVPLLWLIGTPVAAGVLWGLSYTNYFSLVDGWRIWRRNLLVLLASAFGVLAVTAAGYHRVWELALPLEPAHGPPRFTLAAAPKLFCGGQFVFVPQPNMPPREAGLGHPPTRGARRRPRGRHASLAEERSRVRCAPPERAATPEPPRPTATASPPKARARVGGSC